MTGARTSPVLGMTSAAAPPSVARIPVKPSAWWRLHSLACLSLITLAREVQLRGGGPWPGTRRLSSPKSIRCRPDSSTLNSALQTRHPRRSGRATPSSRPSGQQRATSCLTAQRSPARLGSTAPRPASGSRQGTPPLSHWAAFSCLGVENALRGLQVAGLDVGWGQLLDLEYESRRGRFVLKRDLLPGRYPYKFVWDGHWSYSGAPPSVVGLI